MREFDPIDVHRSFGYFQTCLDDGYRDAATDWDALPFDEDFDAIYEFAREDLEMFATVSCLLKKLDEQQIMRLHGRLE